MTNKELANYFRKSNNELDQIVVDIDDIDYDVLDSWKRNVVNKLRSAYRIKMNRLEMLTHFDDMRYIDSHKLNIAKTILRDMYFKYNPNKKKTKINIESEKLLKAREENIDFELELSKMITGDNSIFPYRSSSKLTEFFQSIGYNFVHDGTTRKEWVRDRLNELNIQEIHNILSKGLFKKKYFIDYAKKLNDEIHEELNQHPDFDSLLTSVDDCIKKAKKEFEQFIKDSITANDVFDLSTILDMNVNMELLFDNKAMTEDIELNTLIEEAKERFLSNDKQVGIEKLWAAFERLKTYFLDVKKNKKDKKISVEEVIEQISKNFSKEFLEEEFIRLTKIGNNYRIRHHEKNKLELTEIHRNYFFFRMLTLIDLCLLFLNEENKKM